METVLIVIHLMVVAALVVVVLVQKSEGGALGIGGGGGFMTGRGQANALTRATAVLAAIFFLTSIGLTILANVNRKPASVFDDAAKRAGTSAPAKPGDKPAAPPAGQAPSLFDQLKRMDQGANPPPATGGQATPPAPPAAGSPPQPPAGGK